MSSFAHLSIGESIAAGAAGAMVFAIPLVLFLINRKRYRLIAVVLLVVALVASSAGAWSWWTAEPPLTSSIAIFIDNTRSMGEVDDYDDADAKSRAESLGAVLRVTLQRDIAAKVAALEFAGNGGWRLEYWRKQKALFDGNVWKPSRLQLAQAHFDPAGANWLAKLKARVSVYHLDEFGQLVRLRDEKGDIGEITDAASIARAARAIAHIEPVGAATRLASAVRSIPELHRDRPLSRIVLLTEGVAATGISLVATAADPGVPLTIVGIGQEPRDLRVQVLPGDLAVGQGGRVQFTVQLTSRGLGAVDVPVILKRRDKDGVEKTLQTETAKLDPHDQPVHVHLQTMAHALGSQHYVIDVMPPKLDERRFKPVQHFRYERLIQVYEGRPLKVLYVEGQPRYEFRYIKFLMERDWADGARNKGIDMRVLVLDADENWHQTDRSALRSFPANWDELKEYDVLILGDCDPNHRQLKNHLGEIARFVRGEDDDGKPNSRGRGVIFLAGTSHNPFSYRKTPLESLLPIELGKGVQGPELPRKDSYHPRLTPSGREHPMFQFRLDKKENEGVWNKLAPVYWYSSGYSAKPKAEVLMIHPNEKAVDKDQDRHPLIVEDTVGSGRSLFIGIDETWRWRLRDDEPKFNQFWMQTIRHLARRPISRSRLEPERLAPYQAGQPIPLYVQLTDAARNQFPKAPVVLAVTYQPAAGKAIAFERLRLTPVDGGLGRYRGEIAAAREGTYRFQLAEPDVCWAELGGEKPSAKVVVQPRQPITGPPPLNASALREAAEASRGVFVTLADAERVFGAGP